MISPKISKKKAIIIKWFESVFYSFRRMAGSGQLHVFPDATVTSTDQSAILPKLSPDGGGAPGDADALSCQIPTAFSDPDNPVNVVTAVITGLYLFFGIFSALFGYR